MITEAPTGMDGKKKVVDRHDNMPTSHDVNCKKKIVDTITIATWHGLN